MSVWTGFRAPPGTGLAALKQVTLTKCPACLNAHTWDSEAAYWEQEIPAPPPASFWAGVWSRLRRPAQPHA